MGQQKRHHQERDMLASSLQNTFHTYWSIIQSFSCLSIAFDPPFNTTINVLQEDRLRTSPAAPNTSRQSSHVKQSEPEPRNQKEREPHILRREGQSHEVESHQFRIQIPRRVAINRNPRQCRIKQYQKTRDNLSSLCKRSTNISWMDNVA